MTSGTLEPTRGQLERTLSQRIRSLYRSVIGHQPSQVICNLLENKLIIIVDDAITQPEQLLAQNGQEDLAKQVRSELEIVLESQMKESIEEILGVKVTDLFNDSILETKRMGTIAILKSAPQIRESISKSKTQEEIVST
jgi:uncharacterized protein YbcI